jgi:hypothetical protein
MADSSKKTVRRGAILACVLLAFGGSMTTAATIRSVLNLDPFAPVRSNDATEVRGGSTLAPLSGRPPVRDPFRPPTRSPFIP